MIFYASPMRYFLEGFLSNRGFEQVIAPFLITLRVANRTALTSKSLVSADLSAIHFESRGKVTDGDETLAYGTTVCTSSMDVNDQPETPSPDIGGVEVHTAIEEVPS